MKVLSLTIQLSLLVNAVAYGSISRRLRKVDNSNTTTTPTPSFNSSIILADCKQDHTVCYNTLSVIASSCTNPASFILNPLALSICTEAFTFVETSGCIDCISQETSDVVCNPLRAVDAANCNIYLGPDPNGRLSKMCNMTQYHHDKFDGASCTCNGDCKSNACARVEAGTDNFACCTDGYGTTMYGGYYYCKGMSAGKKCWSDDMCISGYCKGNSGGLTKGVCTNKVDNGGQCSVNADCKNSKCGRSQAGTDNLICCPSNTIGTYGGYDYCYNMAVGTPCWSDAMCASQYCKGNGGGIQKGVCTNKVDNGSRCSVNADCKNNKCGRPQAGTDNLVCCPSNQMGTYAGYDYCYDMAPGTPCWSDAMCRSRNCKGNLYGAKIGHCS